MVVSQTWAIGGLATTLLSLAHRVWLECGFLTYHPQQPALNLSTGFKAELQDLRAAGRSPVGLHEHPWF